MIKDKLKEWVSLHWAYIFYVAVFLFYSAMLYQCGRRSVKTKEIRSEVVKHDTVTNTITDRSPMLAASKPLYFYKFVQRVGKTDKLSSNTCTLKTAVHDTIINHDTVSIPITQNKYKGTNYTAYVSGFHQQLDSIEIREKVITNTIVKKRSRWNVGISAGYGITPKGLSPYIGVGVTWNIFR
jgi:hypothetical protein